MQFIFLTQDFYNDYVDCSEIEQTRYRPYVQVYIRLNGVDFAVPLRSNINHPNALWTDKENRCGLDFSKAVVITKASYIDRTTVPHIRPNEFNALRGREYQAEQGLIRYINEYKKAKRRLDIPRNQTLCRFSTLQYFEEYI